LASTYVATGGSRIDGGSRNDILHRVLDDAGAISLLLIVIVITAFHAIVEVQVFGVTAVL